MSFAHHSAIAYFSSAVLGLGLTPIAIRAAKALGLVDMPNVRKVHRMPIPRIGGLAIALAMLIPFALISILDGAGIFHAPGDVRRVVTLLVGAFSILIVGLMDDIYEVPAKYKLAALLAAAMVFCGSGGLIRSVVIGGHDFLDLGVAAGPVTLLWMVGITVSINFIDGLDGLATGIAAIAAGVLAIGASVSGYPLAALLGMSLCGSLTAFLFFNLNPAKIFMGDCGSLFIGFVLAGSCVLASNSIGSTRSIVLPAVALSVPLFDSLFTMVRRGVLQRRSLFAPERGHIHHRLLDSGLCHKHVVMLLHLVTVAAGAVGLICIFSGPWASAIALGVYCCAIIALFRIAGSVRARETLTAIRRNRAIGRQARRYQAAFYDLQLRFREANTFDAWWEEMCRAAQVLDFAKIDLPLTRRDGSGVVHRWRRDPELLASVESITAEVPIPQRRTDHTVRAHVEVSVNDFLESGGQRLALFSRLMGEFGLNELTDRSRPSFKAEVEDAASDRTANKEPAAFPTLKVAIVHDFLYIYAGAERVLEQLVQIFPQADLFSLFDFLPENLRGFIDNKPVKSSFIQRMPFAKKKHRAYLPLMPLAIEQLDVSAYDLVISSSYVAAKGVITRPDQLHVCYCHTPVRFAWDLQNQYLGQAGLTTGLKSIIAKVILHYVRTWDVRSANGVDVFLTNSDFVGRRIRKVYRRQSTTIYPPVDTSYFSLHEEKEDFYLTASRLVSYKRIELIVDAFNKMPNRRLLVCGEGPELAAIKAIAGPNISVLGHEPADRLRRHMQLAKAFIFAAEEDFGIVAVEAQACGTPVISFARGGAAETVVPGETGIFFDRQDAESIVEAVDRFETMNWSSKRIRANAERFSNETFRKNIIDFVRLQLASFKAAQITNSPIRGAAPGSFDMPLPSEVRQDARDSSGESSDEISPVEESLAANEVD